jgi:hypothetical protein
MAKSVATISGDGIEPVVITFGSPGNSEELSWDGMAGDGKVAPFGIYDVVVDAWDKVGNHSQIKGTWVRPAPVQPTEVAVVVSQPVVEPPAVIPPVPPRKQAESILKTPVSPYVLWPSIGLAAILVCVGSSAVLDRRAQSVRALMSTIKDIRRNGIDSDD